MRKPTEEALRWIVDILRKHKINFQISGGLAAIIYGSRRELYDIDIDLPKDDLHKILPDVEKYIVFGPGRHKDKSFDIELLTLKYKGQMIDISVMDGEKEYDLKSKGWVQPKFVFKPTIKRAFGMNLPIIPVEDLIACKKRIGRYEDEEDLKYLAG